VPAAASARRSSGARPCASRQTSMMRTGRPAASGRPGPMCARERRRGEDRVAQAVSHRPTADDPAQQAQVSSASSRSTSRSRTPRARARIPRPAATRAARRRISGVPPRGHPTRGPPRPSGRGERNDSSGTARHMAGFRSMLPTCRAGASVVQFRSWTKLRRPCSRGVVSPAGREGPGLPAGALETDCQALRSRSPRLSPEGGNVPLMPDVPPDAVRYDDDGFPKARAGCCGRPEPAGLHASCGT